MIRKICHIYPYTIWMIILNFYHWFDKKLRKYKVTFKLLFISFFFVVPTEILISLTLLGRLICFIWRLDRWWWWVAWLNFELTGSIHIFNLAWFENLFDLNLFYILLLILLNAFFDFSDLHWPLIINFLFLLLSDQIFNVNDLRSG